MSEGGVCPRIGAAVIQIAEAAAGEPASGFRRRHIGRLLTVKSGLDNIRVRLALLVLISAVPLLLLSGTIVWQNYRMALDVSGNIVARWRESATARHEAAVNGAEQVMVAVGQTTGLLTTDPAECQQLLHRVLELQPGRYSNFVLLDGDGALRCSGSELSKNANPVAWAASNAGLVADARRTRSFVLGPIRHSPLAGADVMPVFVPLLQGGTVAGFLYCGLRIDWFASSAGDLIPALHAVWIVDSTGKPTQIAATGSAGLPAASVLKTLLREDAIVEASSTGGTPYAYASATLGQGYKLLIAYPAAADRAAAQQVLIRRIFQLATLLLLGLTAVAIGTHAALVQPLDRLSQAVRRWRFGGPFDPRSLRGAPAELLELAQSFSDATKSIAEHAARSEAAVVQQELAMKEIHHRVKNNLQIVASLLNLQASRIRQPEAKAEFASARDRVRALATLHRHLYAQGEVHTINMRLFLTELCGQLFAAMGEREGARITLNIEASELQMSSDQAVPLSLIVTEAVSNALKYAFPGGRAGTVDVCLKGTETEAELMIADDGVGIPAVKAGADSGRDGIGLTLIRGFARQLGGTLTVQEQGGTRYRLLMPLRRESELAEV